MTFEEAREIFLNRGYEQVDGGSIYNADKWRDSVIIISDWLQQEPCEDAISRKAVLDKLNKLIEVERLQGTDEMGYGRERVSAYECMIHSIESEYLYPNIQPKPKTGHWIPVSERLPEMYTYTLWCASSGYVRSDYFNGEFWEDAKKYCYEVIAWMPLPKPYNAESEE